MDYIQITKDNIEKEHICCAMSGKQSVMKKEWLKQRFAEGLVFYRSTERGKCFIEYIPAENAWVPIQADGYVYIDCLWVSGSLKDTDTPMNCCGSVCRMQKGRGEKGCAFYPQKDENANFSPTLNLWHIKGLLLQTHRNVEST